MKKFLGLFLSLALTLSMFSGFALADETDLSSLTFGNGWKIDTSKEYVGDQYKRLTGWSSPASSTPPASTCRKA